jgi:glycosyltransferase involved in cell wall biosynthesis
MRILHLHHRYHPGRGGGELYLQEFSARLAAEGHAVTVATSDALDQDAHWEPRAARVPALEEVHRGVRIRRFRLRHIPLAPTSYGLWRYHGLYHLSKVLPLAVTIRLSRYTPWVPDLWHWLRTTEERFDLVAGMAVLYEPFVHAGQTAARRWGVPFVVYPLTHLGAASKPAADATSRYYTMRHQRQLVHQANAVLAITETERRYYIDQGLTPGRIAVASPGVEPAALEGADAERFRSRYGLRGPIVAFLATLLPDKGVTHVVEAITRLWAQDRPVELVLAGGRMPVFDRFWAALPEAVRTRVCLLGPVDEQTKGDLLAAADIVAMPSRTDSFGIVYLEAWLAGKPVIGARAWAMDEVIADGTDGVLVPFGDVAALAAAIDALLADPERRARMGAAGRAKVLARYTWDHAYAVVREVYARLAGTRPDDGSVRFG